MAGCSCVQRSMSDASNHRRSSHKGKARASSSSQSPDPAQDSRSDSESLPPPSEPVSGGKKVKGQAKKSSASGSVERRTPSTIGKTIATKDVEMPRTDGGDVESLDVNEFGADDIVALSSSSPPHPVPPPTAAATKSGGAGRTAVRSAVSSVMAKRTPTNNITAAAAAVAKAPDDDTSDVCMTHCN